MNGLKLISTGRALPRKALTNDDMRAYVDTSDEWISSRTGIRQRYFCAENESVTTLACEAAKLAFERSKIAKEDIGCVIVATSSGETVMPSTACLVHVALELPVNVPALDVGAACSGFLFAMETARGLLMTSAKRYALVIGTEQMSAVLDMSDRNTCVLFGDGAGAAVFALESDLPYDCVLGTNGSDVIRVGGPRREQAMAMDGQSVFRFAVKIIPECVNELLTRQALTTDAIDWVVCHQANARILDSSIRRLGMPAEKFYKNLDRYANTCAASIPIALDEMQERGLLTAGQRIILVGFGGGLTWGAALLTL